MAGASEPTFAYTRTGTTGPGGAERLMIIRSFSEFFASYFLPQISRLAKWSIKFSHAIADVGLR
jgi:hypothetical protein